MENKTDEQLIKLHEKLIGNITAGQGTRFDKWITKLLEVERELTLRER